MSAAPTPYQSPLAPDPALVPLDADDRATARELWAQLSAGNSEPFDVAAENIRAHIFEASRLSLQNGDEPDAANPFD